MREMKTKELRKKSKGPHEVVTPAPLDGQLRQAVQIGTVSAAIAIPVSLFFVPVLASWAYAGFFLCLGDLSVGLLALLSSPVGIGCNVVVLLGFGLLWAMTDGLREAPRAWHDTAFGLSIAGAVDLVIMGLPVLLIVLNVVVWAVGIALVVGIIVLVLGGIAGAGAMARR